MRYVFICLFCGLLFNSPGRKPMVADFSHSAQYRWLNKEVLETKVLDEMEDPAAWQPFTEGAQQIVDARVLSEVKEAKAQVCKMTWSDDNVFSGQQSLKMRIPSRLNVPGPESGRGWGTAGVRRIFYEEDWTKYNRISLWIYPDNPGFYINWLELRIYNSGTEKLPAIFGQEGETSLILRNGEWNHVVWEVSNVARDRVSALEVSYYMSGHEPEACDTGTFYLDRLELQKVDPDYIEGWKVWPGRISYCHSGYQPGAMKRAIANGLKAKNFKIISQKTGETVLLKPVKTIQSHLGNFQIMDFSEIMEPGRYILQAGEISTGPFRIDQNVWRESIFKALNFFYTERCGIAIPGIHGICHRDRTCMHGDKSMIINGGWHDAGDLTQGLGNTGEAVYAMFDLAERLEARGEDPELCDRLIEEACWGLDWILKTSFRDGYRCSGIISSRRTDGIIGNSDDNVSKANNNPMDHFVAAAAEAIAYRILKDRNPRLAKFSLEMAMEDWHYGADGMAIKDPDKKLNIFRGTFDSGNVEHELTSAGILAAMDLFMVTYDKQYADKATTWADIILNSQQQTRPDWDIPITGFFYTGPDKEHIMHYCHRGREQAPVKALKKLCDLLPDHPDWMKWYAAITLHSEYLKTIAHYTAPYNVLPASIYTDQEYLLAPESRRESFRKQVLSGIPLGKGHYLRLFPVWMDYRGHFGTILPQAQALADAAQLRGDLEAANLARAQQEWIIGRNPFSQSAMWGEGYDYPPLYSVLSGNLVGGLPVGFQSRKENDIPYWPVQSTWTYKEIWVHPVARWIWLMKDLAGPALVEGQAEGPVIFETMRTGKPEVVKPEILNGHYRIFLPEGKYIARSGGKRIERTFLSGGKYHLDIKKENFLELGVRQKIQKNEGVSIEVNVKSAGSHVISIRLNNLSISGSRRNVSFKSGGERKIIWNCRIIHKEMPWIALVVPDHDLSQSLEIRE